MLSALMILLSGNAFAGSASYSDISIDLADGSALGSMIGARNSADPNAFISCQVTTATPEPGTTVSGMFCMAYTTAEGFVFCLSSSPLYVESASSVNATSKITFKWQTFNGQVGGQCTYLDVTNASWLIE